METSLWRYAGVLLGVLLLPPGEADHPSMPAMGCSCPTYHPQNHFCRIADVVFRAVIMWKEPTEERNNSALIGSTLTYSMLTDKVYKRHPKARRGREVLVKTSDSSAMCGVTGLSVNEEYLISGNVVDGELIISLCNFIRPWSEVTAVQKSALKSEYKDSCDTCYVVQEHNRQMRSTNDSTLHVDRENITSMCAHNPHQSALLNMEDCETEYSACVLHRPQRCNWHMNRKYEKCLARRGRKTKEMEANQVSMVGPQSIMYRGSQGKGGSKSLKRQKSKRGKKKIYRY